MNSFSTRFQLHFHECYVFSVGNLCYWCITCHELLMSCWVCLNLILEALVWICFSMGMSLVLHKSMRLVRVWNAWNIPSILHQGGLDAWSPCDQLPVQGMCPGEPDIPSSSAEETRPGPIRSWLLLVASAAAGFVILKNATVAFRSFQIGTISTLVNNSAAVITLGLFQPAWFTADPTLLLKLGRLAPPKRRVLWQAGIVPDLGSMEPWVRSDRKLSNCLRHTSLKNILSVSADWLKHQSWYGSLCRTQLTTL